MKASFARLSMIAASLAFSCNAAHAVTWFDSNIRPDGMGDNNNNVSYAPVGDDGTFYSSSRATSPSSDGSATVIKDADTIESAADVFDSGD